MGCFRRLLAYLRGVLAPPGLAVLAAAFSNLVGPTRPPGWAGRLAPAATGGYVWRVPLGACGMQCKLLGSGLSHRAPATGPLGGLGANTAADSVPGGLGEQPT